jgi:hypothetical protein
MNRLIPLVLWCLVPQFLFSQQAAKNTTNAPCSSIIQDNHGHIDIRCSGLTKEEKDLLAGIPGLLNQILAKQLTAAQTEALFKGIRNQLLDIQKDVKVLENRPEDPNRGVLVPANDPNPVMNYRCEAKVGSSFRLYLGNVLVTSPGFPEVAINIRGKDVLGFTRHDGSLSISASVNDLDGKQVVFIKNGYFSLGDYFRKETPDHSTLKVYDQTDDNPVLYIRYLNQNAIKVTGKFMNKGAVLDVTEEHVSMIFDGQLGSTFSNSCFDPSAGQPRVPGLALINIY